MAIDYSHLAQPKGALTRKGADGPLRFRRAK